MSIAHRATFVRLSAAVVSATLSGLVASTSCPASLIVPAYNSAAYGKTIFLDFEGDTTPTWGTYSPGTTPAYDIDGDPTNFSDQELQNIHKIWQGVSEKFSPWRLNVTTVDPNNAINLQTMRIVIGGNGNWAPAGSGGIAIYNSWVINSFPNIGFVFPGKLGNGNPRYVAEAAAHETGHGFGLEHQSLYDANQNRLAVYHPGNAQRAPIMGKSYFAERGTWNLGPTEESATIFQDDMYLIGLTGVTLANDVGFRADDHGSTPALADPLAIAGDFSLSGQGIIEKITDADFFSFSTPGGTANVVADVAPFAAMLDLSLGLYDNLGNLLALSATSSLGESLSYNLPAGDYRVGVFSAGAYGDVGQYFLSGSAVPEPGCAVAALALIAPLMTRRRVR